MAGDKPGFRIIAKLTDGNRDRFHNVGVAWAKKGEDGRTIVTLRLSPFTDGEALVKAQSLCRQRH